MATSDIIATIYFANINSQHLKFVVIRFTNSSSRCSNQHLLYTPAGVQTNTCYTLLQVFKLTLARHSCRRRSTSFASMLSTSATVANGNSTSAGSSGTLAAPRLISWSSRTCVSFCHLITSCRRPFISTIFSTMYFSWRHAGGPSSQPSSPLCISHDVMQEALHLNHPLHYVFLMTSYRRPFISTIFSTMYFSWRHTGGLSSQPSSPLCISHDVIQEAFHLNHLLHYVFLMTSCRRPFISTIFSTMYF